MRRSPRERHGPTEGEFDGLIRRALPGPDVPGSVDLVIDEGDPASRLGLVAERAEAELLVLGSPREATPGSPDEDRVAASLLRDPRVPVMLVPERPEPTPSRP